MLCKVRWGWLLLKLPSVSFQYSPRKTDHLFKSTRETEVQPFNRKYIFVLSSTRYECIMYSYIHSKSKQINLTFMIARFHLHRTPQNKQQQFATVSVPYRSGKSTTIHDCGQGTIRLWSEMEIQLGSSASSNYSLE